MIKYSRAEPECKKVRAILNSIVDFADFSREMGESCCHCEKSFASLCFLHITKEPHRKRENMKSSKKVKSNKVKSTASWSRIKKKYQY